MRCRLSVCLGVLLASCLCSCANVVDGGGASEKQAEQLVRDYVLNNATDPKAVQFLHWGPNMSRREVLAMLQEGDAPLSVLGGLDGDWLIRVKWNEPSSIMGVHVDSPDPADNVVTPDMVFVVKGKHVVNKIWQLLGDDDWRQQLRRVVAREYPGIKVQR